MTMKRFFALGAVLLAFLPSAAVTTTPDYLRRAVVYQIVLRNFTREGTFAAASEMLPHVKDCGADVVYLTPFVAMDTDPDRSGWSKRQLASGFDSPKNPYRIADYDRIDPEYGTDADFQAFNARAHALGLKVYMDLVYLHCGPNNVLKDLFPDAFQRNADGSVRMTYWRFPYVNHASKNVRRYLIDSMLHWMRLGCDGFRCDVGDEVPVDFWVEAATRCRAENPELVMINEGSKAEWLEKAFDAGYNWPWSFGVRETILANVIKVPWKDASERMQRTRDYEAKLPPQALSLVFMDNHDTAADDGTNRFDRLLPVEAGNAAFALMFLRRGLPLVFNGNEIADNSLNSFFGPVGHPARATRTVDWARAVQPAGQSRLATIRKLAAMRHNDPIWSEGTMEWVTDGENKGVVAFTRTLGVRKVRVAANLTKTPVTVAALGSFKPWEWRVEELP